MLTDRTRTATRVALAAAAAATVVAVVLMPEVKMLGPLVRLVVFHGGSTWVNMGLFTACGLAGVAYLVTGRDGLRTWDAALRYTAVTLWTVNTGLGVLSASLTWRGYAFGELIAEPRLQASFWILLGAGIVLAVDFVFGRARIAAAGDALVAAGLWFLILGASNFMHPDNPVMNSGWDIKLPFLGIVLSWLVMIALTVVLVRDRLVRVEAAAPPAEG